MPYHLKRKEFVAEGIRRIALEQMERAGDELGDADIASAEAVHQARKRLKKIRALLRLVRPLLGKARYRAENRRFRDLGRALSGPRDAEVMVGTLEVLREDLPTEHGVLPFAGLYDHLVAARDAAYQDSGTLDEHKAEVAKALERQAVLRQQAAALGHRVYAEKPGPLSRRLGAYWRVWRT